MPAGSLEDSITGTGRRVYSEWAEAEAAGRLCNWRLDFRYSDTSGNTYRTDSGPLNTSCTKVAYRRIEPVKIEFQFGQACAEIFSNGNFIQRQCHNISG